MDAAQLEDRPLLRTAEVLEVVPGLLVTQDSGEGKANHLATHVEDMPVKLRVCVTWEPRRFSRTTAYARPHRRC